MADGSCHHMVCTRCAEEFCWLCGKAIPPIGHFDRNNLRGCPGLQFTGESFAPLRRFGAKSRVVGRYTGKVVAGILLTPIVVAVGVPALAVYSAVGLRRRHVRRRASRAAHD